MIRLGAEKHGGQNVHIPLDSISVATSPWKKTVLYMFFSALGHFLESST